MTSETATIRRLTHLVLAADRATDDADRELAAAMLDLDASHRREADLAAITVFCRPTGPWVTSRRNPDPDAYPRWVDVTCGPWAATWFCPGCGTITVFDWPEEPTVDAIAALAADARCYRCRRRDEAAPVQQSLITMGA